MNDEPTKKRIAILGGGPSSLFMYKRLVDSGRSDFEITIFEKKSQLGAGMPYSTEGAGKEHITNVSANEIPEIVTSIADWIQTVPDAKLDYFCIDRSKFNEYKVLPRLLFGDYLAAQFDLLLAQAKLTGMGTSVNLETIVEDISYEPQREQVVVKTQNQTLNFDAVVICTGHHWPKKHEGKIPGYFDSPYPPAKLALQLDHPVAVRGSSLTAIDAIRTLARNNGLFVKKENGKLVYEVSGDSPNFKIVMHSRSGLLPAVRFHLDDSHLTNDALLTPDEIKQHRTANDGFLSLDYIFDQDYKKLLAKKDPDFYEQIKDMKIEQFVDYIMELRERLDAFVLFKSEFTEAEKSIKRHESVYWKEMLAVLSFAMNYPAKYFSAEDMIRLQSVLMPLISIVIAFVPQASGEEMMALHDAGVLELKAVGSDSTVKAEDKGATIAFTNEAGEKEANYYQTYVDCVGQPHLSIADFPFKSLTEKKVISKAVLKFRNAVKAEEALKSGNQKVFQTENGDYFLEVPGISINDNFQVIDPYGAYNPAIFIMAVPYIGGYNPDYSGLDFCEAASEKIMASLNEQEQLV